MAFELLPPGASSNSGPAVPFDERIPVKSEESREGFLLVLFMRLLAVLWVVQGLLQWSAILLPSEPLFDSVTPLRGAAVIFFAVFDLVASVGLWLATPWGSVIWLLGAAAQIVAAVALPGFFSLIWIGANIVLIAIYFVLTRMAGHAGAAFVKLRHLREKSKSSRAPQ
ncbi:MAG: DUF6163 family protein [Beijerinckiaceae bacterium]|nr:DUF6163 family protein [Beijerinckiaceae bacterium]